MRPIKFRAWNHTTNEMISWEQMGDDHWDLWTEFRVCETMMQYTGLKDRNGKEIYESDVIMIDGNKKTLVSWSEKFASFCIKNDTWAFQHWFGEALDPSECEVIGNIYKNPNLLK